MESCTEILGIRFYAISCADAKKEIKNALRGEGQMRLFTPNPDIILKAQKNNALRKALNSGALLLPDGIGIVIASRLLGAPLPQRITGIDMGEFIISYAAESELSIFLLGGKPGVAEAAERELRKKYPRLNICGTHHGYFEKSGSENDTVVEKIRSRSPDILFVCFGCPAQELWISENAARLQSVKLLAGLGGSLDVWSGKVRRAPRFVQICGFEWLWRMIREPKRLRGFLNIPIFMEKILLQRSSISRTSPKV